MKIFILIFIFFPTLLWGKTLNISYKAQATPVWCWAASSAMVIEYVNGEKVEGLDLLNSFFEMDCTNNEECNRPGGSYEISEILETSGILNHWLGRALSLKEIKAQIDQGNPLLIGLFNEEKFRGHVMVIGGYEEDKVVIFDSLHESKRAVEISLETLLNNYREGLIWVDTLILD
ncbi:MAG: hypothetical protein DRQ88_04065 [Epsilonproteobacteria bacterium]|nr:MAG: hypothetical protein DRQ88_04065 [Campylobacterota bacterium]